MDETGQIPFWEDEENCNPPKKVSAGQRYIFRRSGMDRIWSEHCPGIEDGTPVVVTQLPSAPKPGTMGQVHISDARTGEFLGMCSMHSLQTQTDELERAGLVKFVKHNPGDIHIDIGSHNEESNPDAIKHFNNTVMKILMAIPGVKYAEAGRMGTGKWFWEVGWENQAWSRQENLDSPPALLASARQFAASHRRRVPQGAFQKNPPIEIISSEPSKTDKNRMVLHYKLTAPMNSTKDVDAVLRTLYPGWAVVSHGSLREGTYPGVRHAYGVTLKRSRRNPPLPASALIDVSTAKTVVREVEEGLRPMGNLGTADHLLDRGLQKLRGSHLGQVDWSNPPRVVDRAMSDRLRVAILDLMNVSKRLTDAGMVGDAFRVEGVIKVLLDVKDITAYEATLERYSTLKPNPPAVEIYRDIVEIKAIKPDGKRYVHKFGKGSNIYGMSDGTILIRSRKGKRLWKNFKTGG